MLMCQETVSSLPLCTCTGAKEMNGNVLLPGSDVSVTALTNKTTVQTVRWTPETFVDKESQEDEKMLSWGGAGTVPVPDTKG